MRLIHRYLSCDWRYKVVVKEPDLFHTLHQLSGVTHRRLSLSLTLLDLSLTLLSDNLFTTHVIG